MATPEIVPAFRSEPTARLLELHSEIMEELRSRQIVRSSNNPTGDYAETLFAKAFGWTLEQNSSTGFDAKGKNGERYQIKCRRLTRHNRSRQLGAIRNLEAENFDFLAGVLLDEDYAVNRAILIPRNMLSKMKTRYSKHVNGWLYRLEDNVWTIEGIFDVTEELRSAARWL